MFCRVRYFSKCVGIVDIMKQSFLLISVLLRIWGSNGQVSDGFRTNSLLKSIQVRETSHATNDQYPVNIYTNRRIYFSSDNYQDLNSEDVWRSGTYDFPNFEQYTKNKDYYDSLLGDAYFRMVGLTTSVLSYAVDISFKTVTNIHHTLLLGKRSILKNGNKSPLPFVERCTDYHQTKTDLPKCFEWAKQNNMMSSVFNEVSLCSAIHGVGNKYEVERARRGDNSALIKWTRRPANKFDIVSTPDRIDYFITYLPNAEFEIHLMNSPLNNCVDGTERTDQLKCGKDTLYPSTPCFYEADVPICGVRFIVPSSLTCTFYDSYNAEGRSNVPSEAFFPIGLASEPDLNVILWSDSFSAYEKINAEDLTHILPSPYHIGCRTSEGSVCGRQKSGGQFVLEDKWSPFIVEGCVPGYDTLEVEPGVITCSVPEVCDDTKSWENVLMPNLVCLPYVPSSFSGDQEDIEGYWTHYDECERSYEDKKGLTVSTFTKVPETGQCYMTCEPVRYHPAESYISFFASRSNAESARGNCRDSTSSITQAEVSFEPYSKCDLNHDTLIPETKYSDRICACDEGYNFDVVDGVLNHERCVPCESCPDNKIRLFPCKTTWRWFQQSFYKGNPIWPVVDPTEPSKRNVMANLNAVPNAFNYFNIAQECGSCDRCSFDENIRQYTDCSSGDQRRCLPCNCNGETIAEDKVCIVDNCYDPVPYNDMSVIMNLTEFNCIPHHWFNQSNWGPDDNRIYTSNDLRSIRCISCENMKEDEDKFMFSMDGEIRCAIRDEDNHLTTGKRFPGCTGYESALPSCVDCLGKPQYSSWTFLTEENFGTEDDCSFTCDDGYRLENNDCIICYEYNDQSLVQAKDSKCSNGEYLSACIGGEQPTCELCSFPNNATQCPEGYYIIPCQNGYNSRTNLNIEGLENTCHPCPNVTCEANQQYIPCTGLEGMNWPGLTYGDPYDRCRNCTEAPKNSILPEDSCIHECLPNFYSPGSNVAEKECLPCPRTLLEQRHHCCGESDDDCGKYITDDKIRECSLPESNRSALFYLECTCKPGFVSRNGACEPCDDYQYEKDGDCEKCDAGKEGNMERGATSCVLCPINYYREAKQNRGPCKVCSAGTNNQRGKTYCFETCQSGLAYSGGGNCGFCNITANEFWTGNYDLFDFTSV